MLTKKDYKAIAEIIVKTYPERCKTNDFCKGETFALSNIVNQLADYFESDNSRFDRQKFYDACFLD